MVHLLFRFVLKIISKFTLIFSAKKSAGKSDQFVDLIASNIIGVFHALFVSQCVGAAATDFSTYLLLGIDFVLNMYFQCRVFYLHKKKRFEECAEELHSLVLNEFLEAIIPFLFLVCFLAAYYGPNAEIIGKKQPKGTRALIAMSPFGFHNSQLGLERGITVGY